MITPYYEKMGEILNKLPLVQLSEWEGFKIDAICADGAGNKLSLSAYRTDKLEKIVLCSLVVNDSTNLGFCSIFPSEQYILPFYFSKWNETYNRLEHLVDFMPSVDSLVDESFRKTYLEPMGELWDRFSHLAGICPEDDDDVRAACSIIYTAAHAAIEKDGQRPAAFEAHGEYLKKYIECAESAGAAKDPETIQEMKRKKSAVSAILKNHIGKILSVSGAQALSKEAISKIINLLT